MNSKKDFFRHVTRCARAEHHRFSVRSRCFLLQASAPTATASAQTFPRRTVTFVVGYAAGGTGDVVARLVAQKLSVALGQSVVVENRAGASGGIAAQSVARATPDGHTILVGQSAEIAINPHWVKNIPYNPEKDLQPIALGVIVPLGRVVPAKAPYASLKELVDAARSSRQGLSFASAGTGTPSHLPAISSS